ncbi:unnamed protein product [Paramecium pentaurelia]|uniref:Uncharacterized protein n=1 Tax=Paramecium pentaurelia TaxID=43138 RepID=A0A8S1WP73_9CILI|nr:unnamed protein product [Paramecium pentaurelia]
MGSKCCKSDSYRAEMLSEIKNFNFNDPKQEFPLEQRVIRELMLDTKTVYQLQICLKKFLLENAFLIKEEKIQVQDKGITSRISAPPLLDQVWQSSILYSQNYIAICKMLVGCIIDRDYNQQNIHQNILKKMLPEYDDKMYQIESEFIIWINSHELEQVMMDIHNFIVNEETLSFELILNLMMQMKLSLCKKETNKFQIKQIQDKNIEIVFKKIQQLIPNELELIIMHKYCLSQQLAKQYIYEYCHFMTILKYSQAILVPSEEVDQVWHTHQCMTKQYRQFCYAIYERFIYHNPTKLGNQIVVQDFYSQTLIFYKRIFQYEPDSQIWPCKEDRWNPQNCLGSWVNLYRLSMSIIQLIQDKLQPNSKNILQKYQTWKGTNVFRDQTQIHVEKSIEMTQSALQNLNYEVGCYSLSELEDDRFSSNQKRNDLFFNDDVIMNSIQ